jgi:hypothetical protein
MSIVTHPNRWGMAGPSYDDPSHVPQATSDAQESVPPAHWWAARDTLARLPAAVQPLLDENSRLVDRLCALTREVEWLRNQVRELEAGAAALQTGGPYPGADTPAGCVRPAYQIPTMCASACGSAPNASARRPRRTP